MHCLFIAKCTDILQLKKHVCNNVYYIFKKFSPKHLLNKYENLPQNGLHDGACIYTPRRICIKNAACARIVNSTNICHNVFAFCVTLS